MTMGNLAFFPLLLEITPPTQQGCWKIWGHGEWGLVDNFLEDTFLGFWFVTDVAHFWGLVDNSYNSIKNTYS